MIRLRPFPAILARAALLAALAFGGIVTAVPAARAQSNGDIVVRTRLIGIYDAQTGKPVDSAEVKDIFTGLSALTSSTGTVVLPLDTVAAFLRVRKMGYNMNTFLVTNTVADSFPVTLTLDPVGYLLPTVVSSAHGVTRSAADTSLKLNVSGFYARRALGEAPSNAYISEVQIDKWKPTLLSDLVSRTGRPWMFGCTLYIDGALTKLPTTNLGPGRYPQQLTRGIDQLLDPSMVAGIEVYRASEVPPQYNATQVGDGAMTNGATNAGCVTLIWTR